VPRTIIIDTYDDEKFGALLAARAIPDSIYAIRMDTPGNRRGDFRDLMREVAGSSTATASGTSRSSPRAA
jgi:nicotinate phosphoribosyltransferase